MPYRIHSYKKGILVAKSPFVFSFNEANKRLEAAVERERKQKKGMLFALFSESDFLKEEFYDPKKMEDKSPEEIKELIFLLDKKRKEVMYPNSSSIQCLDTEGK